jgi:hypothetical protein
VASQAQVYQRSPLDPLPAERTSQLFLPFSSFFTAFAQVMAVPVASVRLKLEATRLSPPRRDRHHAMWPLAAAAALSALAGGRRQARAGSSGQGGVAYP